MTRDEFDTFCASLKVATHVVQWGGASVWKVGGKIFAIWSDWGADDGEADDAVSPGRLSFKCSDLSYQILCELEGIIPAPYLARAMWVQVRRHVSLSDDDMKSYISEAHGIIASKLTRKIQRELGLVA